jgi:hypothetical protein
VTTATRDRLLLALTWLYSLPSFAAFLAYRGLISHHIATSNRLDNANFVGPTGVVILVWCCYFTEGIASVVALVLASFRSAKLVTKVHAVLVVAAGWLALYRILHSQWPPR